MLPTNLQCYIVISLSYISQTTVRYPQTMLGPWSWVDRAAEDVT